MCEEALWRKRELQAIWAQREAQVVAEEAVSARNSKELDLESALQTFAVAAHSVQPETRAFREAIEDDYPPQSHQETERLEMPLAQ